MAGRNETVYGRIDMQKRQVGNVNLKFINGLVFGFDADTGSIGPLLRAVHDEGDQSDARN